MILRDVVNYILNIFPKPLHRCDTLVKNNKYLLVFAAVGSIDNYVSHNLKFFPGNDCIIYKYKNIKIDNISTQCTEIYKPWSWSRFLYDLDYERVKQYKYITIVLDDVKILNYSFNDTINKMDNYRHSASNPIINGSYYMGAKLNMKYTEIFVTTFSVPAWICWWNMMNILNIDFDTSIGWGFDLCFPIFCPHVKHLRTTFTVFHKFKIRKKVINKGGTHEVKKYSKIVKGIRQKNCKKHI